jgi:uncharacterized membrane protein (UPF0127 family)
MPIMKKVCFLLSVLYISCATAGEALVSIRDTTFDVELAVTQQERSQGLMHRKTLAPNNGMLFVYPEPATVSFWMKETQIPLDILFFDNEGQLSQLYENLPPCKRDPCETYTGTTPSAFILEIPAGSARKYGFRRGDILKIKYKSP